MLPVTDHSQRNSAKIPTAAGSSVSSLREATIASWPQSGIEPPQVLTFTPGQTVFYDGDEAEHFFEIVSGTLRCCRLTQDGRRQIYRFAGAGEVLGLGGEDLYGYSAEAVTEVTVRRHRLLSLNAALTKNQELRGQVLQSLRDELASVRAQMTLLGQLTASERVASFLIELSRRTPDPEGWLHLPMTRGDIADYLGLTIETVSRKINDLRRSDVIELTTPNDLRIAKHDRLSELAEAA